MTADAVVIGAGLAGRRAAQAVLRTLRVSPRGVLSDA